MSTATDVVRARDELYTYLAADPRATGDKAVFGLKRVRGALTALLGYDNEVLVAAMIASIMTSLTERRPEHAATNHWVAPELHDSIVAIAEALPEQTLHDEAPPPSSSGFVLLGTPWRWTDPWGHEQSAEAVSWGPSVMPYRLDDSGEEGRLHPTFVTLWTRLRTGHYEYVESALRSADERYAAFGRHGWMITRMSSLFWTVDAAPHERFELGPQRFPMTEQDIEQASGPTALPVVDPSNYNIGRLVHAMFLVLAGAQHVPGSTRDPVPAVALPNRTREKYARRTGSSPLVSMIYAGAQRPPTPRENVGTRGPIGVKYWRSEHTRRRRGPDGLVRIIKVRGAWCGDENAPESERTKVRIASGTLARPADVRTPETAVRPESEAS